MKSLLMEEGLISLNLGMGSIVGECNGEGKRMFLEKVGLGEEISVDKEVREDEFEYKFEEVRLGEIGKLIWKKGIDDMYGLVSGAWSKG
ncbi:hypothetical protein, partial [Bacillus thuringiensis]|uniref:hypothetical protein n=1 Tax=Bacillus thuringiensis TaxID=1428 RepID=UPI0011A86261